MSILTPVEELRADAQREVAEDYRRAAERYADRFRRLRHGPQGSVVAEALSLMSVVFAYEDGRCRALGVSAPTLEEVCDTYGLLPRANLRLAAKALREASN